MRSRERCRKKWTLIWRLSLGDDVVNNVGPLSCSVRVVDDMPRAGSHYNLGTSRGPDKIGSRAGPGPRAASCTWLLYSNTFNYIFETQDTNEKLRLTCGVTAAYCHWSRARSESDDWPVQSRFMGKLNSLHRHYQCCFSCNVVFSCPKLKFRRSSPYFRYDFLNSMKASGEFSW